MSINAHFAAITQEDLDAMAGGSAVAAKKPVVFLGIVALRELRNTCIGAQAALVQAINTMNNKIAEINADERYGAAYKAEQAAKIREKYEPEVEAATRHIAEAVASAEGQEPFWNRSAALLRVKFDAADPGKDAEIRTMWMNRLAKMPAPRLVEVARLAAGTQDARLVSVLAEEVDSRRFSTSPEVQVSRGDADAIAKFMDSVSEGVFDREARGIIGEIKLAGREAPLLARGDRRGRTSDRIAAGLVREGMGLSRA